jgi:hypothetical protein
MEIEPRRLLELAVHVKLASENVLEAARSLTELGPGDATGGVGAWRRTMDELSAMNIQLAFMERILRTAAAVPGDLVLHRASRGGRAAVRG